MEEELKFKLGKKGLIAILVIASILFFFVIFGTTGLRTIIGILLLFFVPSFLIINNFNFELDEKIIFSIFIGIGFFSTFTFWLGLLIGSLWISMIIIFILLSGIGIAITFFKKKKKS
jgi:hypothetical protein